MDFATFESKWLRKRVRPTGEFWKLPIKEYIVTAALLNFEGDETIFAVKALDYSAEQPHWFTIHIAPEDLEKLDSNFELLT